MGCGDEEGGGVVACEGLDELDGVVGDEYEREPRLPPLPAAGARRAKVLL